MTYQTFKLKPEDTDGYRILGPEEKIMVEDESFNMLNYGPRWTGAYVSIGELVKNCFTPVTYLPRVFRRKI